jgi:hypothetical protein
MRLGWTLPILCTGVAAAALSACGSHRVSQPPRVALVPNAIAFRDPLHGIEGTGWTACAADKAFGCRAQGTISATTDGGHSWRVVLRTPRAVVAVGVTRQFEWARFDNGKTLQSAHQGRTWTLRPPLPVPRAPCPSGPNVYLADQVVVTPAGKTFALCVGGAGAGNQSKFVSQRVSGRWKRIAWTPFFSRGHGGISTYGYPQGLAMADDGFGLIWEWRGTLYVTRDGGHNWMGLPKVAVPELDFGYAGVALPHGVGFVILGHGGGEVRKLVGTRDAGRTWHVVHRWR